MKEKTFIPNLNTFSALIDRLIIENIKLVNFENKILDMKEKRSGGSIKELSEKCAVQRKIIALLKKELSSLLDYVLKKKRYEFLPEKRTFSE